MSSSIIKLQNVKGGIISVLTMTAILGGFFVAGTALAAHTATVTVDQLYVTGESTGPYVFEITNNGADKVYSILITAPEGFIVNSNPTCPADWLPSNTANTAQCLANANPSNPALLLQGQSVQISFSVTSPAIEGTYSWTVETTDTPTFEIVSNTQAQTIVDTTSPIVSIDIITTPTQNATQNVTGTFTEANIDTIEVNGIMAEIDLDTNTYMALNIPLSEGENTITAVATDKVGLTGTAEQIVILDTIAPVTSDDASSDWTNNDVTVTLTADDGAVGSGVNSIYYTTDGTEPTKTDVYLGPFIISTSGRHQLMYYSTDVAGNSEIVKEGTLVKIDKEDPVTTFAIDPIEPDGLNGWYVTVPTITLTCEDQDGLSGCDKTFYKWNDAGSFTEYTEPISVPEGNNTLYYYSTDVADNQEVTKSQAIKVDITNPTITDDAPTTWQNGSVDITLAPEDPVSGVAAVKYCKGLDCVPTIDLTSPYTLSYNTEGETIVRYQTWDTAGNASDIGSYTIQIDLTPPVAEVIGAPTLWVNTDQIASAECTDEGGSTCDSESYKLQVSTTLLGSCSTDEANYAIASPATISEHSWVCSYVKDIAGNKDFSDSPVEFTVDQTIPTGQLSDNTEDGIDALVDWQNADATIDLTYDDEGGSEVAVSYLNQVSYGDTCEAVIPYEGAITVSGHSTVCWKVVDNAGNKNTGSSEVFVDQIAPSVDAGLDKITNAQYTQDATVNDEDSGVATYLWEKVSGPGDVNFGSSEAEDTTISANADGEYVVRLTATDSAGNSNSDEATFIWDTTAPTAVITSPADTADTVYKSESVDLTFTPTDPEPGTALTCSYQVDGGESVPVNCESGVGVNTTVTDLADGRRTITLTVTDAAGNSTSKDVSFVVDLDDTLTVGLTDADFTTIQAAIDAASAGDTIEVARGVYNESLLMEKELTLIGVAGESVVITGVAGTNYIIKVNGVDGVVIDSLEINGGGESVNDNDFDYGIWINDSGIEINPVRVQNSVIKNIWKTSGNGIEVDEGSYALIENNIISSFHKRGIRFINSEGKVYDNEVVGDNVDGTSRVQNLVNLWGGSTVEIYGNDLHNALTDPEAIPTWDSPGIFVSSYGGDGPSQANIYNNEIYDCDSGIVVGSYYADTDTSSVKITNNNLHDLGWAINFEKGTISATITENKFSDVDKAVNCDDSNGGPATKPVVDAEENYWGTAVLSTIQDLVYEGVDFDPYYVDEGMTILSSKVPTTVYVDDDYTDGNADGHYFGYDAFTTIQEGIDAVAEGGTVDVKNGTYTEQLTIIDKGLTITGENEEEVIVQAGNTAPGSANVFTINAAGKDITIQSITVRNGLYGIRSSAGNVNVLNSTFYHNGWDGTGIDTDPTQAEMADLWAGSSTSNGGAIRIENSESSEIAYVTAYENARGIRYQDGKNGNIHDNISHNNVESGIYLAASSYDGTTGCTDTEVYSNQVYSNMNNGILVIGGNGNTIGGNDASKSNNVYDNWNSGIMMWHPSEVTVQGNTVSNNNLYAFNGIGKPGDDEGAIWLIGASGVTSRTFVAKILDNTIANNQKGGLSEKIGIHIENVASDGIEITGNTFSQHDIDVWIESQAATTLVQNNSFDGVGVGIQNDDTTTLNAIGNWWGSETGPAHESNPTGTGDAVSDNVDFRPWYTTADLTGLDQDSPTVAITSESSPTNASPIPVTITFSEEVYNFEIGDIVVANGTVNNLLTSDNTVYTADITPTDDGNVTVDVAAEVAWDLAGNYNTAAEQFSITSDRTDPTLSFVSIASDNDDSSLAKVEDTITLTFTSNEEIQTPTVTIAGNSATVSGGPTSWTAEYTMTGTETEGIISFTIDFTDLAGNAGVQVTAVTDGSSVTFDKTAPTGYSATIDQDYINDSNKTILSFTFAGAEVDATYNYSIDDTNEATAAISGSGSIDTATDQITGIDVSSLDDDTLTLTVFLTDPAGNEGDDVTDTVVKDVVAPSVESHTPSDNAVGIDPTSDITVIFDEAVNISGVNVTITGEVDKTVTGSGSSDITISPVSLSDNTVYTITLTGVTDLAGNIMPDLDWSFTTAASYAIELETGWNLISLPVTPTTWASTTEVLASVAGNVERVWSYDAVSGEWSVYNADGAPSDLDIMTAGHGYWVKMTNADILEGVGTLYEQLVPSGDTPPSQLPEIPLAEGWNLIGYYQLPGETTALIGDALSKLDGAWSGSGSDLITFSKGTLEVITPVTEMTPGEGYWIFMTDSRKYSFGSASN